MVKNCIIKKSVIFQSEFKSDQTPFLTESMLKTDASADDGDKNVSDILLTLVTELVTFSLASPSIISNIRHQH